MAVPIESRDSFELGSPVALFKTSVPAGSLTGDRNHFVVAADGQRFLIINLVDDGNKQPITFVANWGAGLRR